MVAPVQVDADKQSAIVSTEATSIVINIPTNAADNDVFYAFIARDGSDSADAITPPTGWTPIGGSEIDNATFTSGIYRRVIPTASSEPATYTWSWTNTERAVGGIIRVTGADNITPEDVTPSNNTDTSVTPKSLSVTTITADTLILACGCASGKTANDWTPPTGMSEYFDIATSGGGAGGAHAECGAAEVNQAGIAATGDKDFTLTGTKAWVAFLIAVRPSDPGGGDGAVIPIFDAAYRQMM